jgi:hypothetical protein
MWSLNQVILLETLIELLGEDSSIDVEVLNLKV